MVTEPSAVGLRLFARLKEAGLPDDAARALAEEFCAGFATKDNVARADEVQSAKTDAKLAAMWSRTVALVVGVVLLSGVVGRIIWGG